MNTSCATAMIFSNPTHLSNSTQLALLLASKVAHKKSQRIKNACYDHSEPLIICHLNRVSQYINLIQLYKTSLLISRLETTPDS